MSFGKYEMVARYVQDTSKQAGRNRKTIQKVEKRFDGSCLKSYEGLLWVGRQFTIHHLELNYFCEFGIPLSTVDYIYYIL